MSFSSHVPESVELIAKKTSIAHIGESYARVVELKAKAGLFENADVHKKYQPLSRSEAIVLRENIAKQAVTEVKKGKAMPPTGLDKSACLILNRPSEKSVFGRHVSKLDTMPIYDLPVFSSSVVRSIHESLKQYDQVVVGLYVPNIKPINNFGLDDQLLKWFSQLSQGKSVHLAVFGNPYALKLIDCDHVERALLAYQDLPEFERQAAEALFGLTAVTGVLPVTT